MLNKTKKAIVRIISFIIVPLLLFSACSDKKKVKDSDLSTTLQNDAENEVTLTYNELAEKLNAELAKKDFSDEANTSVQEVFDKLWKNYPQWQGVYQDLPSVSDYIQSHLIDVIQVIPDIEIIEADSEVGKVFLEAGEPLGVAGNETNSIRMIYSGGEEHDEDIEGLYHEITHCKQKIRDEEYFEDCKDLWEIIIEGGATFHEKFVNPINPEIYTTWTIANGSGTNTIHYKKDNAVGYFFHLSLYENLIYLAGYDLMQRVDEKEIPIAEIKNAITKKYGQEIASEIWNNMQHLSNLYGDSKDIESEEAFECALALQKQCLQCIKQDIANLDTRDTSAITQYMDIYRNYKLKVLPQIRLDYETEITSGILNVDELDHALIDKIVSSNALRFTTNEQLNRMAIKCVLFASSNPYPRLDNEDELIYLPSDIKNTAYEYVKDGLLKMTYTTVDGEQVSLEMPFDENGINEDGIKEAG